MGVSTSHELLVEQLTETVRSIKHRLGVLENESAALRKSVINNNVAHNEHSRIISRIEEHIFNVKLLEEGRSRSVRHHKTNKHHTQSLILK
jgi:hypothetical protein